MKFTLLGVYFFLSSYQSLATNVLLNPDFEVENVGWTANSASIERYGADFEDGSYSYKVSNTAHPWSSINQAVELLADTSYSVSIWVKLLNNADAASGDKVDLRFIYYDTTTCLDIYVTQSQIENLKVVDGWQRIDADFQTRRGYSNYRLSIRSNPGVDFLVDTASMVQSSNVLTNANFEAPIAGSGWIPVAVTWSTNAEDAVQGRYSLRVVNGGQPWSGIRQEIMHTDTKYKRYVASIQMKLLEQPDPAGHTMSIRYIYKRNGVTNYDLLGEVHNVMAADGWTEISAPAFIPMGEISELFLDIRCIDCTSFLVDAASLTRHEDIFLNADFEEPVGGALNWRGWSATVERYEGDAYTGQYSYKVSNTAFQWSSIVQPLVLPPNTLFSVSIMVKLLQQNHAVLGEEMVLLLIYKRNGVNEYKTRASLPKLRVEQGWQNISADFTTTSGMSDLRVSLRTAQNLDFLVDTASFSVIPVDPDWRQSANAKIEEIRKSDLTIQLSVSSSTGSSSEEAPCPLQGATLRIRQTSHAFPFGSVIRHDPFSGEGPESEVYRQTFFDNFNWAVIGNRLKWQGMERNQGTVRYPNETIDLLNEKGIPLRGHNVFWNFERWVPNWLVPMDGNQVKDEMLRRIEYLIPFYRDTIVHWDVNNEHEHGSWFEEKTGDPFILDWMFQEVHQRAPNTDLFLNEYALVTSGRTAQSYVNTASTMLERNMPLHKLGIQSHFGHLPDIPAVKHRLDKVASVGLPIWITELDVTETNRDARADAYDDLITCYFAHPAIEGIMLWGYVDVEHWRPQAALWEQVAGGTDYVPNAAGLRWQEMINERWRTEETFSNLDINTPIATRGFHGNYVAEVIYNGNVIKSQEFQVKKDESNTVDLRMCLG